MDQKQNQMFMAETRRTAREIVAELDGLSECEVCGPANYIEVHHIDGDPINNHPLNLVPLCRACHYDAHRTKNAVDSINEMKREFEEMVSD